MSPLALYIEQVSYQSPLFSPLQRPKVSIYPPSPPENSIFDSLHSSPTLEEFRINRILIYRGSFNPPHRGHLHLLKHAFTRGTHDLNVIAAIILPRSDSSVANKVKVENGKFMFGINERSLLWKQDICFPPWAWVYNDSTTSFTNFSSRLIRATKKDGFALEFVPLYGAGIATPSDPPDLTYGCKTIIMSDAARAAEYQHSSGRLKDFSGCTKWRGFCMDEDLLRQNTKVKLDRVVQTLKTICPQDFYSMLKDGHAYVEEATKTYVARAVQELKAVVTCERNLGDQTIALRFVKCEDVDPREDYNDISSTVLREIMSTKTGVKLREALDWMALSADVLWRCKASWYKKARLKTGYCIKFGQIPELPMPYEESGFYEEPPHFDDPPSLEDLGLVETLERSSSIKEPPSLESPAMQEDSPINEEPQSFGEPPPTNRTKRRYSEAGLEDDMEALGASAGGSVFVAEDDDIQIPEQCSF